MTDTKINAASALAEKLYKSLEQVIKGRDETLKLIITAIIADGHVLLEDYPGSGKTTLCKTLGRLITSDLEEENNNISSFRRIQFTPDLLPGDVLGVTVFEPKEGTFKFIKGPVFSHIVLADEINRTGPKVQAAFLECMAEKQVTVDNVTYPLDDLFFVIGTQNPLDIAGTYPLPIVQLDRFMFKIPMPYVSKEIEIEILENSNEIQKNSISIEPVCKRSEILEARKLAQTVSVSSKIREGIVHMIQTTRTHPAIQYGASTRAAIMLQNGVKAWALLSGRDFVIEDDVKALARFVIEHRIKIRGSTGDLKEIVQEIINSGVEKILSK